MLKIILWRLCCMKNHMQHSEPSWSAVWGGRNRDGSRGLGRKHYHESQITWLVYEEHVKSSQERDVARIIRMHLPPLKTPVKNGYFPSSVIRMYSCQGSGSWVGTHNPDVKSSLDVLESHEMFGMSRCCANDLVDYFTLKPLQKMSTFQRLLQGWDAGGDVEVTLKNIIWMLNH